MGEFESARVYLARWARIVAEEGERSRRREAQALPASTELQAEDSSLGVFELLQSTANLPTPKSSREPNRPVDEKMWKSWFDEAGRPKIREEEMHREVFRRGINPAGTLRKHIWPFLLKAYDWDVTEVERVERWEKKQ